MERKENKFTVMTTYNEKFSGDKWKKEEYMNYEKRMKDRKIMEEELEKYDIKVNIKLDIELIFNEDI